MDQRPYWGLFSAASNERIQNREDIVPGSPTSLQLRSRSPSDLISPHRDASSSSGETDDLDSGFNFESNLFFSDPQDAAHTACSPSICFDGVVPISISASVGRIGGTNSASLQHQRAFCDEPTRCQRQPSPKLTQCKSTSTVFSPCVPELAVHATLGRDMPGLNTTTRALPTASCISAGRLGSLLFVDENPDASPFAAFVKKTRTLCTIAVEPPRISAHLEHSDFSSPERSYHYTESPVTGNGFSQGDIAIGGETESRKFVGVPAWCTRNARAGPPLRPLVKDASGIKRRKRANEMAADELQRFRAVNRKIGRQQREKNRSELDALNDRLRSLEEERAELMIQVTSHKLLLEHLKVIVRATLLSQCGSVPTNCGDAAMHMVPVWQHDAMDDQCLLMSV